MERCLLTFIVGGSLVIGCISGRSFLPLPRTIAQHSTAQLAVSIMTASTTFAVATSASAATTTSSLAAQLNDPLYTKSQFNLPPSLATYPSSFAGIWQSTYKFLDASFTSDIPLKQLSGDVNVAGFRKYSVAFVPDIGSDFSTSVQFKLSPGGGDGGGNTVTEDRQYNLINTLQSANQATVDDVLYEPDKNANRLSLKYTDPRGTGKIELFSNCRAQGAVSGTTFPAPLFAAYRPSGPSISGTLSGIGTGTGTGTGASVGSAPTSDDLSGDGYRTFESLRQVTVRAISGQRASEIYCDYGLECIYYPLSSQGTTGGTGTGTAASGNDFDTMLATVKIFSYLIPQDGLYFARPEKPVGVFLYAVEMKRV